MSWLESSERFSAPSSTPEIPLQIPAVQRAGKTLQDNLSPFSFCLEIHISLGRYTHVTDINQDFQCKNYYFLQDPLNAPSLCFSVSLCFFMGQSSFFLGWIPPRWTELSLAPLSLLPPGFIPANKSWTIWDESWEVFLSVTWSVAKTGFIQSPGVKTSSYWCFQSQEILHLLLGKMAVLHVMLCYFRDSGFW